MNLPLIFEIAIGLIFIYLILSLLTSEIQELVATLLQWRAEHLKKSIENLLAGDTVEDPVYQSFVDDLYNTPLLRSLNQEAKGLLSQFSRQFVQVAMVTYRTLTGTRNIFGKQHSGPSYIPPELFAAALLQKINVGELSQKISELTLKKFRDENLAALQEILEDLRVSLGDDPFLVGDGSLLAQEFKKLKQSLENTIAEFASDRASLSTCLERIAEQMTSFLDNTDALLANENHCKEVIRKRLSYLKQTILRQQLEPTITEVLRLLFAETDHHTLKLSPWLAEIVARLNQESPELLQQVADLPEHLRQSLLSLASQARLKAKNLEGEVRQLETEVANWFNHSMDRASGVYRRNAKGIAVLIGFMVAILINADTFHMLDRLSKDSLLRSTITQAADQAMIQRSRSMSSPLPSLDALPPLPASPDTALLSPSASPLPSPAQPSPTNIQGELQEVKDAVDGMLDEIPLPIGWNAVNVAQQEADSQGWFPPILKRLMGWFITGIALSMGATFWFDLLNKVVQVRSTGRKPNND
jgi:hypothetical protein